MKKEARFKQEFKYNNYNYLKATIKKFFIEMHPLRSLFGMKLEANNNRRICLIS